MAKQAATLDHLSGGRLVLGVAPGARQDDYEVSGADFHRRGRELDRMLDLWRRIWAGEDFGTAGRHRPAAAPGPADADPRRSGRPGLRARGRVRRRLDPGRRHPRHARATARRGPRPRGGRRAGRAPRARWRSPTSRWATAREEAADRYLRDYYAFLGDYAGRIAGSAATDAATVRQYAQGFTEAGCDELIFIPSATDPGQVDLLADALASGGAAG